MSGAARTHLVAAVASIAAASCSLDEAPVEPSWQVDVMPLLGANCVRCHGYPPNGYATPGFRLDSYEAVELANGDVISGAGVNATQIARRTKAEIRPPGELPMPPGRELGDYEIQVLRNWAGLADGSLKAPRGPGRPDNVAPSVTFVELERAGALIRFVYEVRDSDKDMVVGSVIGPTVNAMGQPGVGPIADLIAGRDEVIWDTTMIVPGTYDLLAHLDDGADIDGPEGTLDFVEIPLGSITVGP